MTRKVPALTVCALHHPGPPVSQRGSGLQSAANVLLPLMSHRRHPAPSMQSHGHGRGRLFSAYKWTCNERDTEIAARQSVVSPPCEAGMKPHCEIIGCSFETHQQSAANLPPVHTRQPSKGCPHSTQHQLLKGFVRSGQYPVRLIAPPKLLSHKSLLLSTVQCICAPGGCPCVVDGTIDDTGGVWMHYGKARMPLLRSGSCGLISGLRPAD